MADVAETRPKIRSTVTQVNNDARSVFFVWSLHCEFRFRTQVRWYQPSSTPSRLLWFKTLHCFSEFVSDLLCSSLGWHLAHDYQGKLNTILRVFNKITMMPGMSFTSASPSDQLLKSPKMTFKSFDSQILYLKIRVVTCRDALQQLLRIIILVCKSSKSVVHRWQTWTINLTPELYSLPCIQ